MESTLTNEQVFTVVVLTIAIIVAIFGNIGVWEKWFPRTKKTRLHKKFKGQLTFYRSEVKRPFFGWTPFYASKYNGNIFRDSSWTSNKEECLNNIDTFKRLKNIIEK
jgi:hypothetical protein